MSTPGLPSVELVDDDAAVRRPFAIDPTARFDSKQIGERSLLRGQWHLRRAQWFIVRLFTKRAIPKLVNQLTSAGDALAL